jgi:hypothetical protein
MNLQSKHLLFYCRKSFAQILVTIILTNSGSFCNIANIIKSIHTNVVTVSDVSLNVVLFLLVYPDPYSDEPVDPINGGGQTQ